MSRSRFRRLPLVLLTLLAAFVLSAAAVARPHATTKSGGKFVFADDFDPILLDPALAADTFSPRRQSAIRRARRRCPGSNDCVPKLAKRWKASKDGRSWTSSFEAA